MEYESSEQYSYNYSEDDSSTSVSDNDASVSDGATLVAVSALTDEQFSIIVGDGDFSEFSIETIFGFFTISFVAGFLLASLIMVCRKAFTSVNRILGKVIDT